VFEFENGAAVVCLAASRAPHNKQALRIKIMPRRQCGLSRPVEKYVIE